MGYVEDIQKINTLARELLQHGMATSLDEAVNKAKDMLRNQVDLASVPNPSNYNKQDDESVSQEQEVKVEEADLKEVEKVENNNPDRDEKSGMTWQQAMKVNNEYMIGLLNQYGEQLNVFKQNIADLHKQIKDLKDSQKIVNVVKEENSQQTLQEPQQQSKPEPTKARPRSGNYNDTDVSIEKMFYCGSK